jgi:hypothetical protein
VDFQKLPSGASNLPGVFAIYCGHFGEGPALDPLSAGNFRKASAFFSLHESENRFLQLIQRNNYNNNINSKYWSPGLGGRLLVQAKAFENLSCRCPPRPNPSIPDHKT